MDDVKSVVTEDQILHIQILRYFKADVINMKTLREYEYFANTLGKNIIFQYQVDHDMDDFRAEIRKFILRLEFVTATIEDRKKTHKSIKEKEEAV
eukprot:8168418-Ditylum_brightwellii.AAC.1